jgi:hypothetical protein
MTVLELISELLQSPHRGSSEVYLKGGSLYVQTPSDKEIEAQFAEWAKLPRGENDLGRGIGSRCREIAVPVRENE